MVLVFSKLRIFKYKSSLDHLFLALCMKPVDLPLLWNVCNV